MNTLKCRILTTTGALILALSHTFSVAAAEAGPAGDRPERGGPGGPGGPGRGRGMMMLPLMTALDTDGDGTLSAREIENAVAALKGLDKNKDGQLTPDELRPAGGEGGRGGVDRQEMINRLMTADANGDGKLSAAELPERMKSLMGRADTDQDGLLTREELTAAMAQAGGRDGARPQP